VLAQVALREEGALPRYSGVSVHGEQVYLDILQPNAVSSEPDQAASFVVHFLCRWRMWIVTSKSHSLSAHFVSREAYQDVLISCHQIILVVRLFRDHCPDVPVCFDELGSDCCESFFSSHGSWVVNKRNYTVDQMIRNSQKMVRCE
jgi:hypothetical protein